MTELRGACCSCSARWWCSASAPSFRCRASTRCARALFDQQRGTILDMFNMFSGGALERFSVFALGVMPYISAAIIMQLLTASSRR
jgi:hypothetical protein